jgi:hypothetical protein
VIKLTWLENGTHLEGGLKIHTRFWLEKFYKSYFLGHLGLDGKEKMVKIQPWNDYVDWLRGSCLLLWNLWLHTRRRISRPAEQLSVSKYRVSHKSSILRKKNFKSQNKSFYLQNLLNISTIILNTQI